MRISNTDSRSDVLLINTSFDPNIALLTLPYHEIPINVLSLASYLELKEIPTKIFDMQIYPYPFKLLGRILLKEKPRIVGISSYSFSIFQTYKVAKFVKESDPNIIIIVGGAHASALPYDILNRPYIDFVVCGEGEITLYELISHLVIDKQTMDLDGIAFRENGKIKLNPLRKMIKDINSLPFQVIEKLELDRYILNPYHYLRVPTIQMITSRGCPFKCSFCSVPSIWQNTYRTMSPKRVIDEIKYYQERFNIRDFFFRDDTFTVPRQRVMEICNLIINNKLDISWSCCGRVDTVDYQLLKLMKEAGCFSITYIVLAGTEKSLKLLSTETTLEQVRDAFFWTKKLCLDCYVWFTLGIPGESLKDIRKTIAFTKELNPDIARFPPYIPQPGSKLYNDLKQSHEPSNEGVWNKIREEKIFTPLTIDDYRLLSFYKMLSYSYLTFYFSPRWILQKIKKICKRPIMEIRRLIYGLKAFLRYMKKP